MRNAMIHNNCLYQSNGSSLEVTLSSPEQSNNLFDCSGELNVTSRELPLDSSFLICSNKKHVLKQIMPCLCPGSEQSLIQRHSTMGFNPLTFYTPFLKEMVPLSYTFY